MVPEEISWEKIVLIPKGKVGYRGIWLVELLWKACSVVVNCRLKRSDVLHDALHRFREGIGTGTATPEAKLAQQLAGLAREPLLQVFLDVRNSYDWLDG